MITRRLASTVSVPPGNKSPRKIVLVGAGFLGSYVAKALIADPRNRIQIVSRHPQSLHSKLSTLGAQILPPASVDITSSSSVQELRKAFEGASAVVSLAGLLVGSDKQMKALQEDGARRVGEAASEEGVGRVVDISAIGANPQGVTAYWRTKAKGEDAIREYHPTATVIRPSLLFGPGDSFFSRFATLAKYLPFLPVFGGGITRFQPVYVGDVARAVEICCRDDPIVVSQVAGRIIEAGGPDIFTYREMMELVLRYTNLEGRRAIVSLPYWLGSVQGFFLEKLPETMFTVTRDQVKQLRNDNIVSPHPPMFAQNFEDLLKAFPSSAPSSAPPGDAGLKSVYDILPTYLGVGKREEGKRTHGRKSASLDEVKSMGKR
ncbi:NADH dehydrogenase [Cryptococcus neoformans C23]|uniref:NADH dehydrogenase n=1 Tax=Cryptococcus neoformans (strain H99 / ATCC 208821 / CBS 10515 / FGSC 9487) TaxID=235443 RepID=J9VDQ3_CRYN9|nr:NADH dehydrogenase [Cryptococcus neoformans var. grubii H99]AUB21812.1 NADH dehydrogenase [Cryptococcus neoformans var. grubii]OWZ36973.1 NADH dehydrogenase [Cryptococcus neoformans var. grubii AD2-60a]OWZ48804.1 NADH dehydrogenase [Cryptococcus neoformans var. grubii C23]OXC87519.1 NADH dehydrogenase [Cryptococcus neoformans var. grubii AD1-7a]OXG54898.1 NADH dehydrogenase [Cryptococcus neoformans var. grubii Th84]OXG89411.1 NADH dehydrogenase [Cryptococcus neoformans var. grubii MW-RSA36|eukprot:XP_012046614.1 NADH dehydrogenase [Cryptococcus neoformans var. grubii H99]